MKRLDEQIWRNSPLGLDSPPGLSRSSGLLYRPLTEDDLRPISADITGPGELRVLDGREEVARSPAIASDFPLVTSDHPEVAEDSWFAIVLDEDSAITLFFVASAFPPRPEVCWLRFFTDTRAGGFSSLNERLMRWVAPFGLFLHVAARRGFVGIVTVPATPEFGRFIARFAFRALNSSATDGGSLVPSGATSLLTSAEARRGDLVTFELGLERMRERVQLPAARRYAKRTGLLVLDTGESYEIAFDRDGSVSWRRGEESQPSSVRLEASTEDFLAVSSRQLDPITAVATGRIRVTGDLDFAEALTGLFDSSTAEVLADD